MAGRSVKRMIARSIPALVVILLLLSLALMTDATRGSARFGELYSLLLAINVFALLTMAALIGWNLVKLLRQVAARRPGARLTVRMVAVFVVLAVTPVLVVYTFSLQVLHQGIDSWFDVRVEDAMNDALELSRMALGERMGEMLSQTERMVDELASRETTPLAELIDDARILSGASEVTVLSGSGSVLGTSNVDPTAIVPARPSETILLQLRQSGAYIALEPVGQSGLQVRVVVDVPPETPAGETRILQALYPITSRMNTLAEGVESEFAAFRELAYLRQPLKVSFTLTLSLVLLLSLFTAVWAAFHSARRMVAPLSDLALGTRKVAAGDYETQLPAQGVRDEVGFLVESFNEMTRRLASARDETRQSQLQLEAQRRYLEVVLARLSTGVMTLDAGGRVYTANEAAGQILAVDAGVFADRSLHDVATDFPHLEPLADLVESAPADLGSTTSDWRSEVTLFGASGRQVLLCSGASLALGDDSPPGTVLVFDDITRLIQAQRDAAWSEVARRLAHEIKNPLTPIQLSTERLRHKYLADLAPDARETFDRLTRTIVQQVDAMKSMVNAFSSYARTPKMHTRKVDLNALVADVVELYASDRDDGQRVETVLDAELPELEADPDRLRQILHNLLKNAIEAQRGVPDRAPGTPTRVVVTTRRVSGPGAGAVEFEVADAGPGYPKEILENVFEPYVTTKPKGSGLGLAIVKKIADEHGGSARAENLAEGGASVVVRLPVVAAAAREAAEPPRRSAL